MQVCQAPLKDIFEQILIDAIVNEQLLIVTASTQPQLKLRVTK